MVILLCIGLVWYLVSTNKFRTLKPCNSLLFLSLSLSLSLVALVWMIYYEMDINRYMFN